jgi:toxin secretion/phage lysis holin
VDHFTAAYHAFHALPLVWQMLVALIVLMWIDVATGLLAAGKQRQLSSAVGQKGVTKKVLILLGVATAGVLQLVVDHLPVISDFPSALILITVIGWYIVIELLSIAENFARGGVLLPVIGPLAQRFAEAGRSSGVIVAQQQVVAVVPDEKSQVVVPTVAPPAPAEKSE